LTLADRFKHVLLELPHELYFPLDAALEQLGKIGMVGILSHPERNHGILANPGVLGKLVKQGCLLQVTAGSLTGTFGTSSQALAERLVGDRLVHFMATDAHGTRSRRPSMSGAFERVKRLTDEQFARQICCENPQRVAEGKDVAVHAVRASIGQRAKMGGWRSWFSSKKAG